jgi:NADH-quinone oxidoreductase subunit L
VVTVPLVLLAIPSMLIGFLTAGPMLFGTDWLGHHAEAAVPGQEVSFFTGAIDFLDPARDTIAVVGEEFWHGPVGYALHGMLMPAFWLTVAGFLLAALLYLWKPDLAGRARRIFHPVVRLLEEKYFADHVWINGFAAGGVKLGKVSRWIDSTLIDGVIVNGSARVVDLAANLLRRTQSGYLYHYAFAMIIGLIALLAVLMRFWR